MSETFCDLPRDATVRPCNDWSVDWKALRNGLADARREKKLSVPQLASAIGVKKTTIYRVEKHETQPDCDTIEAWLRETSGVPLGAFFSQYDGSRTPPQQKRKDLDELGTDSGILRVPIGGSNVTPTDRAAFSPTALDAIADRMSDLAEAANAVALAFHRAAHEHPAPTGTTSTE